MASNWTGSALVSDFGTKHSLTNTAGNALILEWINEGQLEICAAHDWPFLKTRIKKTIVANEKESDLDIEIPDAPSVAVSASGAGSLTAAATYAVKVTFRLFDQTGREYRSVESLPSPASSTVTATNATDQIDITSIPTYTDADSEYPTTIKREIYVSKNGGDFLYDQTIADNTTTTATILSETSSTIEPPYGDGNVDKIANEIMNLSDNGISVQELSLNKIKEIDPNEDASGTPTHYARVTERTVRFWPIPDATRTVFYHIFKRPQRIFNDSSRVIQMPNTFRNILDAYVTWKAYEYRDRQGQETKLQNFEELLRRAIQRKAEAGGAAKSLREVY